MCSSDLLSELNWREFEHAFVKLEREAGTVIAATLAQRAKPKIERAADMRFVGQGFELVVALPPGPYSAKSQAALRNAFTTVYKQTFGHVPPVGDIEIINIRVALSAQTSTGKLAVERGASVKKSKGESAALKGKRRAWVGVRERYEVVPVFDRYRLGVGEAVAGPAIVEEDSTTLIVPPKARARVERSGNIVIDMA